MDKMQNFCAYQIKNFLNFSKITLFIFLDLFLYELWSIKHQEFFLKHYKNEDVQTIGAKWFWIYNFLLGCSGIKCKMNCENYRAFIWIQKYHNFSIKCKDWEKKFLAHTHGSIEGIFICWSAIRESREIFLALPEPRELRREAPGAPAGGRVR